MKREARGLAIAGAALAALASYFLWRDLGIGLEWLTVIAGALGLGLVALGGRVLDPVVAGRSAALVLIGAATGDGAWYAMTRADALLPGLLLVFAGSVILCVKDLGRARSARDELGLSLDWTALTASGLAASWAAYFRLFTVGFAAGFDARRLVLTLAWLSAGLVVLVTRPARDPAARWAGVALVGCAIAKATLYDTTHLDGALRVLVLGVSAALLFGGAFLAGRAQKVSDA